MIPIQKNLLREVKSQQETYSVRDLVDANSPSYNNSAARFNRIIRIKSSKGSIAHLKHLLHTLTKKRIPVHS